MEDFGNDPHVNFYDGIEVGAVNVKIVIRKPDGNNSITIQKHNGNPVQIISQFIKEQDRNFIHNIVTTGQATKNILKLPYFSESECIEKVLKHFQLYPDIIISLGGESFCLYLVINGEIRNIISTSKCASGTGEFLSQQFKRMGFSITEGINAAKNGKIVQIATRCSVHCKTDATHKLNKGEATPADIARSLIYEQAKKVCNMVKNSKWKYNSILCCGGVSNNTLFMNDIQDFLPESKFLSIPINNCMEVFGASLFAEEIKSDISSLADMDDVLMYNTDSFKKSDSLTSTQNNVDYRAMPNLNSTIVEGGEYILGIDSGSTTTKAVLMNVVDKSIGASVYLRTLGNPVEAAKNCINDLLCKVKNTSIKVIHAGTTGSGREIVSIFLNNAPSFNEILAHARSAKEEFKDVETVIEIGGQDSKFITFQNGLPVEYAMNDSCSAGTGSFLEESASIDMNINCREISEIALSSSGPVVFGERCAAFINTDIRNAIQNNTQKNDIVAGLVNSIADNYITRIIGSRHVGKNVVFIGGVALNKAVAYALAGRLNKNILVPSHPELMGAYGVALKLYDQIKSNTIDKIDIDLSLLLMKSVITKGNFTCKACANYCNIVNLETNGKNNPFGGLCAKHTLTRHKKNVTSGTDFIEIRNKIMFEDFGPVKLSRPKGKIGLPLALSNIETLPLLSRFVNNLGYDVVLSSASNIYNKLNISPICYPCQIMHNEMYELLDDDIEFIILPYTLGFGKIKGYPYAMTCQSTSILPDIIKATFNTNDKLITPNVLFMAGNEKLLKSECKKFSKKIGLSFQTVFEALEDAFKHYQNYSTTINKSISDKISQLNNTPLIIIAGRPYVTCSNKINFGFPKKITSRGYHVISSDTIDFTSKEGIDDSNIWNYTQQIVNAVHYSKYNPNVYICFVSCFSCGPDSIIYHSVNQELQGKPFCYLEIDSHTADAGFETRVEAFLEIIEESRNN